MSAVAARYAAVKRTVPAGILMRLAELHALTTKVRGTTPLDAPERAAESEFRTLIESTLAEYGISEWHLAPAFGMQSRTLVAWMRSHGLKPQCPSQKSYRGVLTEGVRKPRRFIGGTCANGHLLTEKTLVETMTPRGYIQRTCRTCRSELRKARYLASKSH